MVDEKKEISFQKLQKEIQDLIFLSKRRNVFQEAKDFVRGEVSLSLRDVIILYQSYLSDYFKGFYDAKDELERKLSRELSYPVQLSLSLVEDRWRQDINTPENMKKYWYQREYKDCCKETVSTKVLFDHQEQLLLEEVYVDFMHNSYLKNKKLGVFNDIYPKYQKDLKKLMSLYYSSVASVPFLEKVRASETEKSFVEISFLPFYRMESRKVSDDPDISGEWAHFLNYYSEESPINLIVHKVPLFPLKSLNYYGHLFISFDLDYHLQDAFLYLDWDFLNCEDSKIVTKDSDSRLFPEMEFMISETFPNLKVYLKDLPDFFADYLEKYKGTDYLIEGKKRFDKRKEKERVKELKVVNRTKQLLVHNNLKIVKLMKDNQELYEKLGERQPITKDILCKMVEDDEDGHWVIRSEFRDDLEYYDLSGISFDNVDVRGVDFRNTNIRSSKFDPQTVYHRDLSGCFFESLTDSIYGALFDYSTNFTGVNLSGTMIKQSIVLYNNSIVDAEVNQHTILPDELWRIRKENSTKKNIKN